MMQDSANSISKVPVLTKVQGALLGAAVGDALGWPQEFPKRQLEKKSQKVQPSLSFQRWERKAGGQYRPHIETILPGEYSDDTQLILCTARSLVSDKRWWEYLTTREYPAWLHYERGGGGATLRAVRSWVEGRRPWSNRKLQKQYFEAGGNGVAMRILPHCLRGAFDKDFTKIASSIVANGITTHGHPRALVGALAYGFAIWIALRSGEPLTYGMLIDVLLEEISTWSLLPDMKEYASEWEKASEEVFSGQYKREWQATVSEVQGLLLKSQAGMNQGALSIDTDILEELGCFSKEKGSGTITAVASVFLASRYAADPSHGVVKAAFAHGSDTDTLASMTGALLGAIAGVEWLNTSGKQVQDSAYLKTIGKMLMQQGSQAIFSNSTFEITSSSSTELFEQLEQLQTGDKATLADCRESIVLDAYLNKSLSQATRARTWKLETFDGQTVYVKKVWYDKGEPQSKPESVIPQHTPSSVLPTQVEHIIQASNPTGVFRIDVELLPVKAVESSVRLSVDSLENSKFFYGRVLGLECVKESRKLVRYGNIWLMERASEEIIDDSLQQVPSQNARPSVWVEVEDLEAVYENVRRVGLTIEKNISKRDRSSFFICRDPSGYVVLVNEQDF